MNKYKITVEHPVSGVHIRYYTSKSGRYIENRKASAKAKNWLFTKLAEGLWMMKSNKGTTWTIESMVS